MGWVVTGYLTLGVICSVGGWLVHHYVFPGSGDE